MNDRTTRVLEHLQAFTGEYPSENGRGWKSQCPNCEGELRVIECQEDVELVCMTNNCPHEEIEGALPCYDAGSASSLESGRNTDQSEGCLIPATLKERRRARNEIQPVPASKVCEMEGGDQIDWLWANRIARRSVTLMVGMWKAGKTTLLSHLLRTMDSGGDLAGQVQPARVLVISEESSSVWAERIESLKLGDNSEFDIRPYSSKPRQADWEKFISSIANAVGEGKYDLVIFDSLQSVNPCEDENDSTSMMKALTPLHQVTEAGAAVLLVHHPRKGETDDLQSARGSGALPAFVDLIVVLKQYLPSDISDRRRVLSTNGRIGEPQQVVIELGADGYKTIGLKSDATRADRLEVIKSIIGSESLTSKDVFDRWEEQKIVRPGQRSLDSDLAHGCDIGMFLREGRGVKGDAYTYANVSRTPQVLEADIENHCDDNEDL